MGVTRRVLSAKSTSARENPFFEASRKAYSSTSSKVSSAATTSSTVLCSKINLARPRSTADRRTLASPSSRTAFFFPLLEIREDFLFGDSVCFHVGGDGACRLIEQPRSEIFR